jgi:transposase
LDVHKDSIAVVIAPADCTEIRKYGVIGGTLDALDKLIKKLAQPEVELPFVYEAAPRWLRHLSPPSPAIRLPK